ncbi:alpha/beta hydrolase [Ravibacter arvi]|uniref:Alpha/beta hydrolase n=1 Tax=Ravibacter arvi TaxID=2051041 RepID=A0ABP8LKU5_9BACT
MAKIILKNDIEIFYTDLGHGKPVILIHGWPLSHKAWEPQVAALTEAGFRVIAYDRRGFGKSSAPSEDYDYDSFAADLNELINRLDLSDVTLVGFSMGGGEVVRYLTRYGNKRIAKAALVASIIPSIKQTDVNPEGVPQKVLDDIIASIKKDRPAFLTGFGKNFYNYSEQAKSVSPEQLHYDWSIAVNASPLATIGAAKAWMDTDFTEEAKKIGVPTLIIHGDADQTVPIQTSGDKAAKLIPGSIYKVYKNAPHGLNITHRDQLNTDLIEFLKS